MSEVYANRLKVTFNIGSMRSFQTAIDGSYLLDDNGNRNVKYLTDNIQKKFPLIYLPDMLDVCCEMNLFLIHRATGEYSVKKRNTNEMSVAWSQGYVAQMKGEPIDLKTVDSISKDLKLFLDYLRKHKLSYLETVATPVAYDDRELLPVWKYRSELRQRVKARDLGWDTAQRMIRRVREFYVWSYHRGKMEYLPFSLEFKAIRKKKENDYDVLFLLPNKKDTSITAWVSDLSIPKIDKQPQKSKEGLQPFSRQELTALLLTNVAKHRTYGLFLKCAYLAGLRSFEVVQIDYSDIKNPAAEPHRVVYQIGLVRKHNIPKPINISRNLMIELFNYTQHEQWRKRRIKHESKYGIDNKSHPLPLFLNSSGERMAETSPSDTIGEVKKEQRAKEGEVLSRTYHDLRATFGTYLAIYLINKLEDIKRVRAILRKWMGHEDSKTSEGYIDFAKASDPSEFGEMHDWVEDIYIEVDALIKKEKSGTA